MTTIIITIVCAIAIGWSFSNLDMTEAQRLASAKSSRDAITPEVVDALIDVIYVERIHQVSRSIQSIIDDREEVLADVDSVLFERGEFPGSTLAINEADFCRLVRVITRVYEDTHCHIPSTKAYMRAALSV